MPGLPLVVSFYTCNTPYEVEVRRLLESCERFQLETYVECRDSIGNWHLNCCQKGPFVLECLHRFQRPVLWLDADAEVVAYPKLFEEAEFDFGVYIGEQLNSGTAFFAYTPKALTLVDLWAALCQRRARSLDQVLLDQAYRRLKRELKTRLLPQSYCKVFDAPWRDAEQKPVIVHHQASRRHRAVVDRP